MSHPAAVVSVDLNRQTHTVGRLWVTSDRGRERATFEYDDAWLERMASAFSGGA